ncbi:MAG: hypothetical protein CL529_12665 [Aequorivita sp.]|nr:hypothetical protein [Aequorivita sp.]|tara:strand:+ start:23137 stop:23475 length:339 start_codon:yes stop_codon:yes gene_type:complete
MPTAKSFYDVSSSSASVNSNLVRPLSGGYSINVVLSESTYNVDVKLQVSGDGTTWTDITGASQAGVANGANQVHFDINAGYHAFVRVVITRNSGTFSASCYLSNERQSWVTP